jgi:hypothetical protein
LSCLPRLASQGRAEPASCARCCAIPRRSTCLIPSSGLGLPRRSDRRGRGEEKPSNFAADRYRGRTGRSSSSRWPAVGRPRENRARCAARPCPILRFPHGARPRSHPRRAGFVRLRVDGAIVLAEDVATSRP